MKNGLFKETAFHNAVFFLQYEAAYFSKFLSLNSALLCKYERMKCASNRSKWHMKILTFYYASIRSLSLGTPFWHVFSISVAPSLGMMHAKHYPKRKRVVGMNIRWKRNCAHIWDNKKYFKNHSLLAVLSHLRILYQLKYLNKKVLKTTLLWTSRSVTETCKPK